jgi:hypothetical protein
MILTNEQLLLLSKCIGSGPIDTAQIIILGNELGTASGKDLENTIKKFEEDWTSGPILQLDEGFSTLNIKKLPINSTFLQFVSKISLALQYKDEEFFDKQLNLRHTAKIFNYITNELYRTNTSIINLYPLPRSSESSWEYDNIDKKEYYRLYNFMNKNQITNEYKNIRINAIKYALNLSKNSLLLGSGNKENKKAFFELIYPDIKFKTIILENIKIYFSENPKIILSNYFDNRRGIGLNGLKLIYKFIIEENLV